MILYANGCSYTTGCELEGPHIGDSKYNKDRAWPAILGKNLGATEVINEAKAGGSNDRIIRTSLDWILSNRSKEKLLVVIGWTDPYRTEIKIDGTYHHICSALQRKSNKILKEAHRHFTTYYCDDSYAQPKKVHQVILMQDFLKLRKINYFFFNAILSVQPRFCKHRSIGNAIDLNNYLHPFDMQKCMLNKVFKIFKPVPWGTHPEEAAHRYWGNFLYNEIKRREII